MAPLQQKHKEMITGSRHTTLSYNYSTLTLTITCPYTKEHFIFLNFLTIDLTLS